MKKLEVEEHRVASFDGTDLAYHVVGEGPSILLANGLGGSWKAWSHQIHYFQDRYRFVSWDYRGLYRSGAPPDPDAVDVASHARDAIAVMDDAGVEQTAIFGWSMGVQVGLELFRQAPDRVKLLVLINGVAGAPWESAFNVPGLGRLIPRALAFARAVPSVTQRVTERVVQWPETVTWAKRVGLAGRTLDEDVFAQLAGSFADLDMDLYVHTLERLGEHDARDVLDEIDVPLLVIAGDRDLFTPRIAAEEMIRRVRGAELLVVPGGTHYVAVEYPELVNLRIEKFFRERGHVPA
ncbi:MAG TPA: alpha/beta hydrolase [Sandaracinaceae bacterium LLY-WYZ-13_1]|nr:alpha/beta hydrolase [Sandaracinaceae bacterium LLY-WYZ-13_1]